MSQTYPSALYQNIVSAQENHFWFVSRSRMITAMIRTMIAHPAGMHLLEIGCGTGIMMNALERMGLVCTGLDVNAQALVHARGKTKGTLIRQSIFQYKPKIRYDVIGVFDVMEHIGDDRKFLKACHALLVKDGYLFLTVPAGMWLWSHVDTASGHVRRYESSELVQKLQEGGFAIKSIVYWNVLLLPLYVLWHRQMTTKKKDVVASHLRVLPRTVNTLFQWIFSLESVLARYIRLPVGATLVVCAQKKDM